MNKTENPPAFPVVLEMKSTGINENGEYNRVFTSTGGMTLRDYFAAKAMQGIVATDKEQGNYRSETVACWAYQIADAMLEARQA